MNVKEVIAELKKAPPNAEVWTYVLDRRGRYSSRPVTDVMGSTVHDEATVIMVHDPRKLRGTLELGGKEK